MGVEGLGATSMCVLGGGEGVGGGGQVGGGGIFLDRSLKWDQKISKKSFNLAYYQQLLITVHYKLSYFLRSIVRKQKSTS